MDTQTALGNAGAPFEIEWRGRKFKVLYRVQRIKAKFERWAKDQAIRELLSIKTAVGPDEYTKLMREKLDQFESDDPETSYAYDGKRLTALKATTKGKLAHVRTMIEGGDALTDEELEELLFDQGDVLIAYTSACAARVEGLLKDMGKTPDPKEIRRRLKAAGMWE